MPRELPETETEEQLTERWTEVMNNAHKPEGMSEEEFVVEKANTVRHLVAWIVRERPNAPIHIPEVRVHPNLQLFNQRRRDGLIPREALYGGVHNRRCGHRGCQRVGGADGVRFYNRLYRCEQHRGPWFRRR